MEHRSEGTAGALPIGGTGTLGAQRMANGKLLRTAWWAWGPLAVLPAVPSFAAELNCLAGASLQTETRKVGVETIYKAPGTTITVFLPMPRIQAGSLIDLNSMDNAELLPEKLTFSDGTLLTAFNSVDLSADSTLNGCLDELEARLELSRGTEAVLQQLTTLVAQYLGTVPEGFRFPWDPANGESLPPEFRKAADLDPGHYPLITNLSHVTVPLEWYLREGRGYCLQKVLFTSFLLKRLNIPHRIRAGGSTAAGHMWIELDDGRHLDPTWNLLEKPTEEGAPPGWFRLGKTLLFQDQFFPAAVDE